MSSPWVSNIYPSSEALSSRWFFMGLYSSHSSSQVVEAGHPGAGLSAISWLDWRSHWEKSVSYKMGQWVLYPLTTNASRYLSARSHTWKFGLTCPTMCAGNGETLLKPHRKKYNNRDYRQVDKTGQRICLEELKIC